MNPFLKAREDAGLIQKSVAFQIGISHSELCKIEREEVTPSFIIGVKLCEFYRLDANEVGKYYSQIFVRKVAA